nr:MAG TPA: hypothetical protein [Caudoviricetes sp.]
MFLCKSLRYAYKVSESGSFSSILFCILLVISASFAFHVYGLANPPSVNSQT